MKNYKIAVAGTGYVGLSLGVLFAQHHQVVAVDIVQAKVDMINNKKSPIGFSDWTDKFPTGTYFICTFVKLFKSCTSLFIIWTIHNNIVPYSKKKRRKAVLVEGQKLFLRNRRFRKIKKSAISDRVIFRKQSENCLDKPTHPLIGLSILCRQPESDGHER